MTVNASTTLNEADVEWKDHISAKGKPFQIGLRKGSSSAADVANQSLEGKKDFGITVFWENTNNVWMPVTPNSTIETTAITRYSLGPYNQSGYQWIFYFTNTEHYDYNFHDKTGDSYEVNTYINRDHYVRYSSDDPTIIYVTGK